MTGSRILLNRWAEKSGGKLENPMTRVHFLKGGQKIFLKNMKARLGGRWDNVAKLCEVTPRTLRDWAREKYNMDYRAVICLSRGTENVMPKRIKVLPEHWGIKKAAEKGGKRYVELYGPPGTIESRRKGGLAIQRKICSNPSFAKKFALAVRKEIRYPKKSPILAEFIGIMLGDGGISNNYQISISFNAHKDLKYANYIQRLVNRLFSISSTMKIRKKYGSGDIIVNSRNLVEFLGRNGIKKGNKIARKVDIPNWIWSSEKYKIACLRGLIDTDGCFFRHSYIVNGRKYSYLKMCFTSYSAPLLRSVTTILENLGLGPQNTAKNRVYLYSLSQLQKYVKKVGTSNPRYIETYNNFVVKHK